MQLEKTHHESGCGIYAKSLTVDPKDFEMWGQARAIATEMVDWFNEANGSFDGEFERAFAIAHAQVTESDTPFKIFVVDKGLVDPKAPAEHTQKSPESLKNYFWEAQAIFNCEVLDAPRTIKKKVPQRKVGESKDGKAQVEVEMVETDMRNMIEVPEGCMSFRHRKEKKVERRYSVKVRYQYIKEGLLRNKVETFEGWVEGLKAHIIQHECDHFDGKNIYFKT